MDAARTTVSVSTLNADVKPFVPRQQLKSQDAPGCPVKNQRPVEIVKGSAHHADTNVQNQGRRYKQDRPRSGGNQFALITGQRGEKSVHIPAELQHRQSRQLDHSTHATRKRAEIHACTPGSVLPAINDGALRVVKTENTTFISNTCPRPGHNSTTKSFQHDHLRNSSRNNSLHVRVDREVNPSFAEPRSRRGVLTVGSRTPTPFDKNETSDVLSNSIDNLKLETDFPKLEQSLSTAPVPGSQSSCWGRSFADIIKDPVASKEQPSSLPDTYKDHISSAASDRKSFVRWPDRRDATISTQPIAQSGAGPTRVACQEKIPLVTDHNKRWPARSPSASKDIRDRNRRSLNRLNWESVSQTTSKVDAYCADKIDRQALTRDQTGSHEDTSCSGGVAEEGSGDRPLGAWAGKRNLERSPMDSTYVSKIDSQKTSGEEIAKPTIGAPQDHPEHNALWHDSMSNGSQHIDSTRDSATVEPDAIDVGKGDGPLGAWACKKTDVKKSPVGSACVSKNESCEMPSSAEGIAKPVTGAPHGHPKRNVWWCESTSNVVKRLDSDKVSAKVEPEVTLQAECGASTTKSARAPHVAANKERAISHRREAMLDATAETNEGSSSPKDPEQSKAESWGALASDGASTAKNDSVATVAPKRKKKTEGQLKKEFKNKIKLLPSVQGKVLTITHDFYEQYNRHGRAPTGKTPNFSTDYGELAWDEFPALGSASPTTGDNRPDTVLTFVASGHESDDSWSDIDFDPDVIISTTSKVERQITEDEFPSLSALSMAITSKSIGMASSGTNKKAASRSKLKPETKDGKSSTLGQHKLTRELSTQRVAAPITKKPKANSLIQFDLSQMLTKKNHLEDSQAVSPKGERKTRRVKAVVANILDSSAPSRRRGKEREQPTKKRPTPMKKIILRERLERKIGRESSASPIVVQPLLTAEMEKLAIVDVTLVSAASEEPRDHDANEPVIVKPAGQIKFLTPTNESLEPPQPRAASPIVPAPIVIVKPTIHNRRFREYCDQMLNPEIDELVTKMLQDLIRFHDRLYQKDPIKAKMRRRMVIGIREVTKHLKLKKIKCVILAPNVEKIKSSGGLDDAMNTVIALAREQDIPFVFALGRRKLGYVCLKKVPISCVGIFNYDGTENHFKQLCTLAEFGTEAYHQSIEQLEHSGSVDKSMESV